MIVLFMVVSFVIGCVNRMCQLFLSECVLFSIIVFSLVIVNFLPFFACGRSVFLVR